MDGYCNYRRIAEDCGKMQKTMGREI